jgi:hypothetical protein
LKTASPILDEERVSQKVTVVRSGQELKPTEEAGFDEKTGKVTEAAEVNS